MAFNSRILNSLRNSVWLRSGIAVASAKGITIVANFLIFYLLVRICSTVDFGIWVLFTSIYTIFEVANNSFVNNAIIKYYGDYKDQDKGVFIFNALLFSIALTLVFSCILLASVFFIEGIYHSETLSRLLYYGAILLLISGIINFVNCIEQANLSFYSQLIASVFKAGTFIIYLFYLLYFDIKYSLSAFVLIQCAGSFLALLFIFFITKKHLVFRLVFDSQIGKKIAKYGFFTFGVEVIGQVSGNIGQLITGALLSPAAVGIINVSNRVLQFLEIPLQSIATVLLPKGVMTLNKEGMTGIKKLYEQSSGLITAVMLPVLFLFFIFSDYIIYFIAGDKFPYASVLLKVSLIYTLLKPFGRNAGVILNAIGKTKINFAMVIVPTVINLGLNYLLIKTYGVIGSPIATLIATAIGFVFNQFILYRIAKVSMKQIAYYTNGYFRTALSVYRKKRV